MTHSPSNASRGFTLIELLVGLAILSLLATMLLAGVFGSARIAAETRFRENTSAQIASAQLILRQRIEGLRPLKRLDVSTPLADLQGGDHLFDFFAPAPDNAMPDVPQHYRLLMTAPGDLMLYRISALNDQVDIRAPAIIGWTGSTLLTGASSLAIDYFGVMAPDRVPRWHSFWQDQPRSPQLVRVRVRFPDGDRRVWPDLIVRPLSTLDLSCDPEIGQRCPETL